MQPIIDTSLRNFVGKIKKVVLPSGNTIEIRECNGNDDDILTNTSKALKGESLVEWIAEVTLTSDVDGGKPTPQQVSSWPLSDKYYAVLEIRIHSLGSNMEFTHTCSNPNCGHTGVYDENLDNLLVDFSTGKPLLDNPEYKDFLPKPYPSGIKRIIETRNIAEFSGMDKHISFNLLDSTAENYVAELGKDETSRNKQFIARGLTVYLADGDNKGIKVTHFGIFSKRQMVDIANVVTKYDPQFELEVPLDCPACGTKQSTILLGVPSFLFPTSM